MSRSHDDVIKWKKFSRYRPFVNNREAGDLRRHRAHYDVTVMNVYVIRQDKSTWVNLNAISDVKSWPIRGELFMYQDMLLKPTSI